MLDFHLAEGVSGAAAKISYVNNNFPTYRIEYPCKLSNHCTYYQSLFPPGKYKIKICGANGGIKSTEQVSASRSEDYPYAGGCTTGVLTLNAYTKMFIHLGGHGQENTNLLTVAPGGYNGGGDTNECSGSNCGSSGGGASDIRAETNDVFHRIIVAGAGGGGDNLDGGTMEKNDGKGGSGGGLEAQGWYCGTSVDTSHVANQTSGFTFGNGESGSNSGTKHPKGSSYSDSHDIGGAGGGWFGGFASNSNSYGAGGGSSFILTENAVIPQGDIEYKSNDYTTVIGKEKYAFADKKKYLFKDAVLERGVWLGNGFAEITIFSQRHYVYTYFRLRYNPLYIFVLCLFISK